jgi:predicted ABC-type ATPase
MLEEIEEHVRRRESFAFETTLSGLIYARMIPTWQSLGYSVRLIFLRLPNPEMAIARVAARTVQGGHSIPEVVIRRRFEAGWRHFNSKYKLLVNLWSLYDSSQPQPVLIEEGLNDEG